MAMYQEGKGKENRKHSNGDKSRWEIKRREEYTGN